METALNITTNNIAKLIVNSLKYGKHYFVAYNEKDEKSVIEKFVKHHNSFVLLKTTNIQNFNKNTFHFYYDNIDLNLLFSDDDIINLDYAEKNKVPFDDKYINYIYFYIIPEKINRGDSEYIRHYNSQISKLTAQTVSKNWFFKDEIILDKQIFLKFSDPVFFTLENEQKKKNEKFITLLGGIGDFFITFSLVYDYLENSAYENNYIMNWKETYNFKYMANLLFGDKIKLLDTYYYNNRYIWEYWHNNTGEQSLLSRKVHCIFDAKKGEGEHAALLFKKCLMGEKKSDYYQYNHLLEKIISEAISEDEKNYIESIVKNKKKNIGLQYFTGSFNKKYNDNIEDLNNWDIFGNRKWDSDNIKEFIEQCKKNDINIIVLNYETYDQSLREFCTKKMSIAGYAFLISKMDMVVGVDSSAGHIAAFYNIPSITLWGEASPLAYYGERSYVGYRPLRKNYSVLARDKNLSSIGYDTVLSLVKDFLENKLVFEDKTITYQDSLDGYNMLYI